MNEQQVNELFTTQQPADEPPLPPGYLESIRAAGVRGARLRRLRTAAVGVVGVVAALVFTGTASYLGNRATTTPASISAAKPPISAAEKGYGSYDPLVQRLDPGWLPAGSNSTDVGCEQRIQSLQVARVTGTEKRADQVWGITIYLLPPGVGPASDGPLEGVRFGHGKPVHPVQGMRAELLSDPNGYSLAWKYPSGAHAVVTLDGFGHRTAAVARKIAEHLGIDGHAPLRYPFAMPLPAGQHVVATDVLLFRLPGQPVQTNAVLTYAPRGASRVESTVMINSHPQSGKPTVTMGGKGYLVPDTRGFYLQVLLASGDAKRTAEDIQIFGKPRDMSTWRANPVLDN